ncbi:hypothetical protein FQA47_009782, partial [Oryzias melastigma]
SPLRYESQVAEEAHAQTEAQKEKDEAEVQVSCPRPPSWSPLSLGNENGTILSLSPQSKQRAAVSGATSNLSVPVITSSAASDSMITCDQ